MTIQFDETYLKAEAVPATGVSPQALQGLMREGQAAHASVQAAKAAGELGFTKLPHMAADEVKAITGLADEVRAEFSDVVVVGIGGSDLGARAVHRALNHQFYNLRSTPRLFFAGDTTDPVALREILDVVDLAQTCVIVISKSGNTIEQMSTFTYLRHLLIETVGEEASRRHIIILTDGAGGTLRGIVEREGYRSLAVPGDVGGRFSVLSTVRLFPLAIAGVDIEGLLAGARAVDAHDSSIPAAENLAMRFAAHQYLQYGQGRPISVFMPYAYGLRETGFWFRQLWAESLGKRVNLTGEEVHTGPTPIAAVGPTDQHSQVQPYMEGPADKVFTFVTVERPAVDMTLPEAFPAIEGVAYMAGHTFAEILAAEQQATALALAEWGRPSGTLRLPELSASTMGELLYFLELAVTYAGALFAINTFDQPGVELGKNYMYGLMGREGYERPGK